MHLCSKKDSRTVPESAVELDSVPVGTCASSLGWGTGKPRGTQGWKRES